MKERIIKFEKKFGMDGFSFSDKNGSLDSFFPIKEENGKYFVSEDIIYKISDLQNMGFYLMFEV